MAITDEAAEDLLFTYGDMVSELESIFESMPILVETRCISSIQSID